MTDILATLPEGVKAFGLKALAQIHDSETGRELQQLQRAFQPYEDMIEAEMEIYDRSHPIVTEIDRILELVRIRQRVTAAHTEAHHLYEKMDRISQLHRRQEYDVKRAFMNASGTEEQFQALRQTVLFALEAAMLAPAPESVNPVREEKSEAEIQAEYAAKVALMPPELVAKYVPLIKAYERTVLRFHTELAAVSAFNDADIEMLEKTFEANNPLKEGEAAETRELAKQQYIEAGIDALFPGVRQQILELSQDYGGQLEELEKPFSIENFTADGGTQEQLNDLRQAVLCRVFSRPQAPQPPQGPVPG